MKISWMMMKTKNLISNQLRMIPETRRLFKRSWSWKMNRKRTKKQGKIWKDKKAISCQRRTFLLPI